MTGIYYLQDLDDIRDALSSNYFLIRDLDFTDNDSYDQTDVDWETKKAAWTTGTGWTALGTAYGTEFTGKLYGEGKTIKNLFINNTDSNVGLFSRISNAAVVIDGLTITGADITTTDVYAGVMVGRFDNGIISNCETRGELSGAGTLGGIVGYMGGGTIRRSNTCVDITDSGSYAGGIVGNNAGGTVEYCDADCDVSGTDYVGGAFGNLRGTVKYCSASGDVTATGTTSQYHAGGFSGYCYPSACTECYSTGNVTAEDVQRVGGFSGYLRGTLTNCFSTGSVTTSLEDNTNKACFIGNSYAATIQRCYATGEFIETSDTEATNKGFIGEQGSSLSEAYNYFDSETTGQATTVGSATAKTTSQMKDIATFSNWSIALKADYAGETWRMEGSYPILGWNYIEVYYLQDLYLANDALSSRFRLMNDLDFDVNSSYDSSDVDWATKKTAWTTGDGWDIIGDSSNQFGGEIDGNGKTISNLFIDRSATQYQGLIAYLSANALIYDLNINGDVTGANYSGLLAGRSLAATIKDIEVSGDITGSAYAGGLIGLSTASLTRCNADVDISGTTYLGGIIGSELAGAGGLLDCQSYGTITSSSSRVGGLIGRSYGAVSRCKSEATVTGTDYLGGLIGEAREEVSNSYSMGLVTRASGSAVNIGGFAGHNYQSPISKCYSTGAVEYTGGANPTDKGFVGSEDTGGAYADTDNFFDTTTSSQTTTTGNATAKTTAEMQDIDTFTDTDTVGLTNAWDMVAYASFIEDNPNTWYIEASDYPRLWFEYVAPTTTDTNFFLMF